MDDQQSKSVRFGTSPQYKALLGGVVTKREYSKRIPKAMLSKMQNEFEAGVMCWAIGQELGRSESAVKQTAARHGWQRPDGFRERRLMADRWEPSSSKLKWLKENWHSSLTRYELEAELGVSLPTIRRAAIRFGLSAVRNKKAITNGRYERCGGADREKRVIRLLRHSDLTRDEIAMQEGLSKAGLRNMIHRLRYLGVEIPYRKTRLKPTSEDLRFIRRAAHLGIGSYAIARMLRTKVREVLPSRINAWIVRYKIPRRNTRPRAFRVLSPEQLLAYERETGREAVEYVQKVYCLSRELTVRQALKAISDYREALDAFPQLADLSIRLRHLVPVETRRSPHPMIEALRTVHAKRKAA